MIDTGVSQSVLLDQALVAVLMPWPCPSEFGAQGRYRLEELVGAGRSSLVYRATDLSLSSAGFAATVAIKIGRKNDSNDLEGLTARRITHPNVLRVLDRGVSPDGHGYVVTEYVPGGDLQARPGPWEPRKAAEFMAKLARAVHASHSAGVVHCDLKPANILLTAESEPKLADFDLSRSVVSDGEVGRGNVAFMSPEQFAQTPEGLTPLSDVYALGGILYFLLTGTMPHGDSVQQVAAAHAANVPPPSTGRTDELERICTKALARDREARYESAAAFAGDLERWLRYEPLTWGKTPLPRRTKLWCLRHPYRAAATGGAALLLFAATVTTVALVRAAERERQRQIEAQAEVVRNTNQMVEDTRARVRQHVLSIWKSFAGTANLQDQMLPTLVWLEWISDAPVIGPDGKLAVAAQRIDALKLMVEHAEKSGHATDLDARLARFALAHFLLVDEQAAAASELLPRIRDDWSGMLGANDPIMLSIAAMEVCCKARLETDVPASTRIASLTAILDRLDARDAAEPARRLLRREIKLLAKK